MITFYCIECFNKYCDYIRYLAEDDQGIPYLTYEGLVRYPNNIKQFRLASSAKNYLKSTLSRESFNISELTISQRIELIRINNSNKYFVVRCHIDDAENFAVESKEVMSEFTRNWNV